MPITRSAKKALRQSLKRKVRNLKSKNEARELLKQVRSLVLAKKFEEVKNLLPRIYKALDKAAKTGVLKKNTAARKKSRIAQFLQKASSQGTQATSQPSR